MIDHDSTLSPTDTPPVSIKEAARITGASPGFYTDKVMELVHLNLLLYDMIDAMGEFYDVPDDDIRMGMGLLPKDLRNRCLDLKDTWEGCVDYLISEQEKAQSSTPGSTELSVLSEGGDAVREPPPESYSPAPMPDDIDRDLWCAENNVRDEIDALEETYYLFYQFIEALFDSNSTRESTSWTDAKCGLMQWKNWLRFRHRRLGRLAEKEFARQREH